MRQPILFLIQLLVKRILTQDETSRDVFELTEDGFRYVGLARGGAAGDADDVGFGGDAGGGVPGGSAGGGEEDFVLADGVGGHGRERDGRGGPRAWADGSRRYKSA